MINWINTTLVHPKNTGGVHVVRFLTKPSNEPYAPFDGVCTVDITSKEAILYAMQGKVRRQHIRSLMQWLLSQEVFQAKAHRAPSHTLPGAQRDGDWMIIDLMALNRRM